MNHWKECLIDGRALLIAVDDAGRFSDTCSIYHDTCTKPCSVYHDECTKMLWRSLRKLWIWITTISRLVLWISWLRTRILKFLKFPEESSSKRSPKKKKRCVVMLCFSLFLSLSLGAYYEVMEMNFGKQKEVFLQNRIIHKSLSQFCNNCHCLKYSNWFLWPIFRV